VGTYGITQGTLANSNYAITYTPADLTINRRAITVTADNQSKAFGAADPLLTFRVTSGNLVGSDTLGPVDANGGLGRVSGEAPGQYDILASQLSNPNYAITAIDGLLTIRQALPPLPNPVILPVFADNGSRALAVADRSLPEFGGLNYLAAPSIQFVPGGGVTIAQAQPGSAANPIGSGSASGGPGAAVGSSGSGAAGASSGPGQSPSGATDVASAGGTNTARGSASSSDSADRKGTDDLNVNNVAVPSARGPLDVFVVGTGVNLSGVTTLRSIGR
jgi:hypothetical protein